MGPLARYLRHLPPRQNPWVPDEVYYDGAWPITVLKPFTVPLVDGYLRGDGYDAAPGLGRRLWRLAQALGQHLPGGLDALLEPILDLGIQRDGPLVHQWPGAPSRPPHRLSAPGRWRAFDNSPEGRVWLRTSPAHLAWRDLLNTIAGPHDLRSERQHFTPRFAGDDHAVIEHALVLAMGLMGLSLEEAAHWIEQVLREVAVPPQELR